MKIVKTWGHSTSVLACKERTQQTAQRQRQREPQSWGVQHAWLKSRLLYFPQTFQLPNSNLVKTSVVFLGTIHSINNFVISTWLRIVSNLMFSLSPIKYNAKKKKSGGGGLYKMRYEIKEQLSGIYASPFLGVSFSKAHATTSLNFCREGKVLDPPQGGYDLLVNCS